jgi:hypothetical protein
MVNRANMDKFGPVDRQIREWAERHTLKLHTSWDAGECRAAYLSSKAGECFQIWIDPPEDSRTCVHAAEVEGRDDPTHAGRWSTDFQNLDEALETAFQTVLSWIAPSERN